MQASYLLLLIISIGCLVLVDYRYKLAAFVDVRRTLLAVLIGTLFFLMWDVAGIHLGIFFTGETDYLTGLRLMPDLPIEEVFFLLLLNYNALLLWRGGERIWPTT